MAEKDAAVATPSPSGSKGPLILALVNSLAILGAMGMVVYTKMIYQHPVITESGERQRLADLHASPLAPLSPLLMYFEPITINIASNPGQPKPMDGTPQQIQGKLHYATVGFAIEIRDPNLKEMMDGLKAQIMDYFLSSVGRKSFQELTSVQGRYVLKAQILEGANRLATTRLQATEALTPHKKGSHAPSHREAVVTNVFFTDFIVQ